MKLYHGTSEAVARLAITEGLKTRENSGSKGNWEHSIDSAPDRVYMSVAYAGYFAYCATESGEPWGIVEIDTDLLCEDLLLPDEDFLEQASQNEDVPEDSIFDGLREAHALTTVNDRMKARTAFYRDNAFMFGHLWSDSIKFLGNCCYWGNVPSEAISRVTVFDPKSNHDIYMSVDPTITLMNYRFCAQKYKAITRWLAGYTDVDAQDLTMLFGEYAEITLPEDIEIPKELQELVALKNNKMAVKDYWRDVVIPNRKGLEIIKQSA